MTLRLLLGLLLIGAVATPSGAQSPRPTLDVGIRLQKTIGLYVENGLTVQYSHPKLTRQRLVVGLSYVTSRLGTALGSNAVKQDNLLVSASCFFRPARVIRPVLRLNAGYFRADYGFDLFNVLPRTSPLISPELGLYVCPRLPLKVGATVGYNLLTGNGISGPGTLYPVFVQTSVTWNVLR